MKRFSLISFILGFIVMTSFALAGEGAKENFEKIKSLTGEWEGKNPEGKMVLVTYEVVSNGSAVMERMQSGKDPNMITMFHLDGDHLMLTHYCSAMNQPRMRSTGSEEENVIMFSLLDVTNLSKPAAGHMQKLILTFKDEDHLVTQWTFVEDGKEHSAPFNLVRKKSMK